MFGLSHWEILIILVIALLLFGRKLPDIGRHLGKGIVDFKKGLKGVGDEIEAETAKSDRLEQEKKQAAYRAPLTETGEDLRVSRVDAVDAPPTPRPQ